MGFKRHILQQKRTQKEWAAQTALDCPWPEAFSVDQEYSLVGCSPAEPASACPDKTNIIPTIKFKSKSYSHVLGFR